MERRRLDVELRRLSHELAWSPVPNRAVNVRARLGTRASRLDRLARGLAALLVAAVVAGCASGSGGDDEEAARATTVTGEGTLALEVTEIATGLETPWSLAWDREGRLWFTERAGRLTRLGGETQTIEGVVENGEAGLMGLEFDEQGRAYLMYTAADENAWSASRRTAGRRCSSTGSPQARSTMAAGSASARAGCSTPRRATPATATSHRTTGA